MKRENIFSSPFVFFSILRFVYYYVEREAVNACKTVMCVCMCVRET